MYKEIKLALNPYFENNRENKKIRLLFRANSQSIYQQKVVIQGPHGVNIEGVSTGNQGGGQFIDKVIEIDFTPSEAMIYTIQVEHRYANEAPWEPSVVKGGSYSVINSMYMAYALGNDGGNDLDFADSIVEIIAVDGTPKA